MFILFKWTQVTQWRNIFFKNVFLIVSQVSSILKLLNLSVLGINIPWCVPKEVGPLWVEIYGESFVYPWDRVYGVSYGGSYVFHFYFKTNNCACCWNQTPRQGKGQKSKVFTVPWWESLLYDLPIIVSHVSPLICIFIHTTWCDSSV